MKDILIIFCVLLVLLLIISTLGGSVRLPVTESYVEAMPADALKLVHQEQPTMDHFKNARVPPHVKQETHAESRAHFTNSTAAAGGPDGFDNSDNFANF